MCYSIKCVVLNSAKTKGFFFFFWAVIVSRCGCIPDLCSQQDTKNFVLTHLSSFAHYKLPPSLSPQIPLTFPLLPVDRPSLRVYPDSSPMMPVASDGTRVTVQTQGCPWLATALAQTPSSLGIDEIVCACVCVFVCVCARGGGSDSQITGLTQTYPHTPWTKTILSHMGNYARTSNPILKCYTITLPSKVGDSESNNRKCYKWQGC